MLSNFIYTILYTYIVILGGAQFVLEKRVDDLIEKEASKYPEFSTDFQSIQYRGDNNDGLIIDDDSDNTSGGNGKGQNSGSGPKSGSGSTLNRQERRLKKNFLDTNKK